MVKLREAFSHKIHLHIRQGMLQRLWDKYVPAASPEYEQIQLVYLGEQAHREQAQYGQTNLLISLVLKNRIMQMGLAQCPVKTAFVRRQMENSLQRMGRYYLTQLKCCNFVMYRKAERFMSLLEQAETGRNRYLKWQKESQSVEKQREHYHMISKFAINIREFLAEHSQQTMRVQERELLHLLSKKEYREFCRLCRVQSDMEYVDGQTVKWKKNKDKMFHSIDRLETTQIRSLWAQMEYLAAQDGNIDTILMRKLLQIRQQYRREVVKEFWEHVLSIAESEQFKAAADMAKISRKGLERQISEEERVYLSGEAVREFLERIEEILEQQKRRIEQQEAQIISSYQDIYQQTSLSYRRENRMEEERARKLLVQIKHLQAEEKEEFVEELAERILLRQRTHITDARHLRRSFGYTEGEINGLISYIAYVMEKKEKREAGVTEETAERTFVHTTELAEREAEELYLQIASVLEKKTSINIDNFAEGEIEEILSYIVDKGEQDKSSGYTQTVFTVTENMHYSAGGKEERRMLLYLHNLEAEKRTEFIEKLAERVLLQQRIHVTEERNSHNIADIEEELSHRVVDTEKELFRRTVDVEEQNLRETDVSKEEVSYRMEDTKEGDARIFGYTKEQIEGLLSYVSDVVENKKKAGEIISRVSEVAQRGPEEVHAAERVERGPEKVHAAERVEKGPEKVHAAEWVEKGPEEIHTTEIAEREAVELYWQLTSVIERKEQTKLQRSIAGGQDIQSSVSAPYEKLWEWGKALLFHPEQEEATAEADFLPAWKEKFTSGEGMPDHNLLSLGSGDEEEIQTEIIRRQIEAAKERNTLSQFIDQINHRIDSVQEEEKEGLEQGGKLTYADSQLNRSEVKSLLHFIKELDEKQYGKLVEELSEITKLQWKLHSQGSEEIETTQVESSVAEQKDVEGEQPKLTWVSGSLGKQYVAIAYPALVYRIEEFEKYRQREVRGKIQSLGRMYLQQTEYLPGEAAVLQSGLLPVEESLGVEKLLSVEESPGVEKLLSVEELLGVEKRLRGEESDNIWRKEERMLDLQYNMPSSIVSEEEQEQDKARMREENAQLKLAQEQIDRKLKEVEVQLQKVETAARAKEDVRAFAEQVKSQLYEELHVEKLRRGLI